MKAKRATPKLIDDYVATFPNEVQETLGMVRAAIRKPAPKAEEPISYQIPAFKLNGRYLIYVAAFKKHIGLYPLPKGDAAFKTEITPYRSGKASVRLPLDEPIPFGLIRKMVKFREKENLEWEKAKGKKKRKA